MLVFVRLICPSVTVGRFVDLGSSELNKTLDIYYVNEFNHFKSPKCCSKIQSIQSKRTIRKEKFSVQEKLIVIPPRSEFDTLSVLGQNLQQIQTPSNFLIKQGKLTKRECFNHQFKNSYLKSQHRPIVINYKRGGGDSPISIAEYC